MRQAKIKRALDKMSYYTRRSKHYKEALTEINKIVMKCLPIEHDTRPEITEWLIDKNRDEANGFNKAIAEFKANWEG